VHNVKLSFDIWLVLYILRGKKRWKRQQNLQEEVGVALRKTQEEIKQQMDRRRREVEK